MPTELGGPSAPDGEVGVPEQVEAALPWIEAHCRFVISKLPRRGIGVQLAEDLLNSVPEAVARCVPDLRGTTPEFLEVAAAYFIDERGWSRKKAVAVTATTIFALGIPSALSGGDSPIFGAEIHWIGERNWFDSFDYLASNWMLPLGGLGIAAFAAWRLGDRARHVAFAEGSRLGAIPAIYLAWLQLLRYLVPVAIVLVMLNAIGVLKKLGLGE